MDNCVRVKIADYSAIKDNGMLITVGLGSCVGVTLYDPYAKVAGLAHILLSDSTLFKNQTNLAKFADTAIPLLVEDMERLGARKNRVKAKIAGGSQLFSFEKQILSVGEKNIESVRTVLSSLRVPIAGEDVGGKVGRTLKVLAADGTVLVSTVGSGERKL